MERREAHGSISRFELSLSNPFDDLFPFYVLVIAPISAGDNGRSTVNAATEDTFLRIDLGGGQIQDWLVKNYQIGDKPLYPSPRGWEAHTIEKVFNVFIIPWMHHHGLLLIKVR